MYSLIRPDRGCSKSVLKAQQLQLSSLATDYDAKQPSIQYTRFKLTDMFFNNMILFMYSHVHTLLLNGYLRFYCSTKHLRGIEY